MKKIFVKIRYFLIIFSSIMAISRNLRRSSSRLGVLPRDFQQNLETSVCSSTLPSGKTSKFPAVTSKLPGGISRIPAVPRNFRRYLESCGRASKTSGTASRLPATLDTSGGTSRLPAVSRNFRRCLETPGGTPKHPAAPRDLRRFSRLPALPRPYLETSGGISRIPAVLSRLPPLDLAALPRKPQQTFMEPLESSSTTGRQRSGHK